MGGGCAPAPEGSPEGPGASRAAGRLRQALRRSRRIEVRAEPEVPAPVPPAWSACYAPHSTIYFDQVGRARACCQNTGTLLGDVAHQSIREIWDSAEADRLRTALEGGSYDEGCEFCAWQVREGNDEIVFARGYDHLRPTDPRPRWPRRMELALTNTCNLQCAMCNGEWSSAIRSRREHLPPLPRAYDDAFFDELAEFLPHLESVQFAGGEPFLGAEPLRAMEQLAALERPPAVSIITNGTTLTPRVERLVEVLQPHLIVSIDGATTETYDAIRVGAHLPDVLAHLDRFVELVGADHVSITTCLMASNWREFHRTLGLAEARGLDVGVNVVRLPVEHSLYQLGGDELAAVVATLRATEPELTGPRLAAWTSHVDALAHRADLLQRPRPERDRYADEVPGTPVAGPSSRWAWLPFPEVATAGAADPTPAPSAGPEGHFTVDLEGTVSVQRLDPALVVDGSGLDGRSVAELMARLASAFGDPGSWHQATRRAPTDDDRFWLLLNGVEASGDHELIGSARRDGDGSLSGLALVLRPRTREASTAWT
ncbi:radical SAM protein [Aquihabitans sp. G128]|uniref:radical SAM protein n=1 Tax=Aquihabitans sp. G128 TaxID=2849779 RepID=UPI001C236B5B|nr:radical SAM protein [Aquihabitans sp. G128]QXC60290.1 radical SAM protein [Aquihabitans sp. G128]